MVDERDIGEGSAWHLSKTDSVKKDLDSGNQWLNSFYKFQAFLTKVIFHPAECDHAVSQEATRLNNLLQFEQNCDVTEDELTQCNSKGERVMPSQQCAAPTAKGEQCKRRTKVGCYCYTHTRVVLGLKVAKSNIEGAGRGLFTAVARKAGEEVCRYTGDRIRGVENPEFKGSLYVAQLDKNTFIDAARTNAGAGRWVNSPKGQGQTNLKWVIDTNRKTVRLVAKRDLAAGTELLIGYGGGYWNQFKHLGKKKDSPVRRLSALKRPAPHAAAADAPHPAPPAVKRNLPAKRGAAVWQPPLAAKQSPSAAKAAAKKRRKIALASVNAASFSLSPDSPKSSDIADSDPRTFDEAMSGTERKKWLDAIAEEEKALNLNKTFTPIYELPKGTKLVGCKFVFKRKRNEKGQIARYKVRLVAQGFRQLPFVDYDASFSPVMSLPSLRLLIARAAALGHRLTQIDFKTAYLNATLDKNILMRVPPGMQSFAGALALQVEKGIYGLKQSGLLWFVALDGALVLIGYTSHAHGEQCLFVRQLPSGRNITIGVYVDDLIISADPRDSAEVESDIKKLNSTFQLTNLGEAKHILGIEVRHSLTGGITLSQGAYIERICSQRGFTPNQCRAELTPCSTATPLPITAAKKGTLTLSSHSAASALPSQTLQSDSDEPLAVSDRVINAASYATVLGECMYAANCTRPDIAQTVNWLARYSAAPTTEAIAVLIRLIRYLSGTCNIGLTYTATGDSPLKLVAYSDSD